MRATGLWRFAPRSRDQDQTSTAHGGCGPSWCRQSSERRWLSHSNGPAPSGSRSRFLTMGSAARPIPGSVRTHQRSWSSSVNVGPRHSTFPPLPTPRRPLPRPGPGHEAASPRVRAPCGAGGREEWCCRSAQRAPCGRRRARRLGSALGLWADGRDRHGVRLLQGSARPPRQAATSSNPEARCCGGGAAPGRNPDAVREGHG